MTGNTPDSIKKAKNLSSNTTQRYPQKEGLTAKYTELCGLASMKNESCDLTCPSSCIHSYDGCFRLIQMRDLVQRKYFWALRPDQDWMKSRIAGRSHQPICSTIFQQAQEFLRLTVQGLLHLLEDYRQALHVLEDFPNTGLPRFIKIGLDPRSPWRTATKSSSRKIQVVALF